MMRFQCWGLSCYGWQYLDWRFDWLNCAVSARLACPWRLCRWQDATVRCVQLGPLYFVRAVPA